jgi:hypothetical protein
MAGHGQRLLFHRSAASPTRDLKWYDAYNALKHNREAEFWIQERRHREVHRKPDD